MCYDLYFKLHKNIKKTEYVDLVLRCFQKA